MNYYSTSGSAPNVGLREAVFTGKAPDDGLYMPSRIPLLPNAFFNNIQDMTVAEIAYVVANTLFSAEVDSEILSKIASDVFTFDVPLRKINANIAALELYHGPTGSFNDIGARFLSGLLAHLNPDLSRPVNFLMATSGDSGAAVARALHNQPGARVTVLFPSRRLSSLQLAQLSTLGGNVTAVEVSGTLDDCRNMVDNIFANRQLVEQARLTPASSVNIARFLPQIFYYFHAYALLRSQGDKRSPVIALPGGNLGNLASGLVAKRMGLPIGRFIVTTKAESAFVNYLENGDYSADDSVATRYSSIDVRRPSNFPRIVSLYQDDPEALRRDVKGRPVTDLEMEQAIASAKARGYETEGSSAAAWMALEESVDPTTETGLFLNISAPENYSDQPVSEKAARMIERSGRVLKIGRSQAALKNFLLSTV